MRFGKNTGGSAQSPQARKEETGGERSNRHTRVSCFASLAALPLAALFTFSWSHDSARAETFFATEVVEYSPGSGVTIGQGFGVPERILGGPRGAGRTAGSLDVLTLGMNGSVTVGFDSVRNERYLINGRGSDFIISENAFYIGGDQHRCFGELAYVEVSSDGVNFARFPSQSLNSGPINGFGSIDPDNVSGLAGSRPTLANVDSNTNNPFAPEEAGGNAFDLSDLLNEPLVIDGTVCLNHVRYIRVLDIVGDGTRLDSGGRPIYDPTAFSNSCDIDAFAIIHGCTAGDFNGDGKREDDDVIAMVNALLDDKAQNDCADSNADGVIDGEDIQAFVMAWAL